MTFKASFTKKSNLGRASTRERRAKSNELELVGRVVRNDYALVQP